MKRGIQILGGAIILAITISFLIVSSVNLLKSFNDYSISTDKYHKEIIYMSLKAIILLVPGAYLLFTKKYLKLIPFILLFASLFFIIILYPYIKLTKDIKGIFEMILQISYIGSYVVMVNTAKSEEMNTSQ